MTGPDLSQAAWHKSSYSGGGGESSGCVEVASVDAGLRHVVAVRDSKDPGGPVLCLTAGEWAALTHGIKRGGLSAVS